MTPEESAEALDTAVRKLTAPNEVTTMQRQAKGRKLIVVTHPSLIQQLQNGLVSTGASYGGSAPQSRNILDADAIQKLEDLRQSVIASWHDLLPGVAQVLPLRRTDLADSLATWHLMFTKHLERGLVAPAALRHETRRYTAHAAAITAKFDPPPTIEGTAPCPRCGARWTDPGDLGDRTSAILYSFHGTVDTARATCRACGHYWVGREGLLTLTREQNRAAQARHAPTS